MQIFQLHRRTLHCQRWTPGWKSFVSVLLHSRHLATFICCLQGFEKNGFINLNLAYPCASVCTRGFEDQRRVWKQTQLTMWFFFSPFYKLFPVCYCTLNSLTFLIRPKRTVNFGNQCLWRHLARDYTKTLSRTHKGNHIMYDRGGWFLKVTMSSSRLPS